MLTKIRNFIVYYSLIAVTGTPILLPFYEATKLARFFQVFGRPLVSLAIPAGLYTLPKEVLAQVSFSPMDYGAANSEGRSIAESSRGSFQLPEMTGNEPGAPMTLRNGVMSGHTLESNQVTSNQTGTGFVGSSGTATAGGIDSMATMNGTARANASTGTDGWSNGYQTVHGSATRRNLWDYNTRGDGFLNNSETITDAVRDGATSTGYSGCITTTSGGGGTTTTENITATRTCQRNTPVTSCSVTRGLSGVVSSSPDACSTTDLCEAADVTPFTAAPSCAPGTVLNSTFVGRVGGDGKRNGVVVEHICNQSGYQLRVSEGSTEGGTGAPYEFLYNPATNTPASVPLPGFSAINLATSATVYSGAEIAGITCATNGNTCDVSVVVHFPTVHSQVVHLDEDPTAPLASRLSTAAWTCTNAAKQIHTLSGPLYAGSPAALALTTLFPGEDHNIGFCLSGSARSFSCHCESPGSCAPPSNCGPYEADAACSLTSSTCIVGSSPNCIQASDTYTCVLGTRTVTTPVSRAEPVVTCPGAIRCMGTDCIATPEAEQNDDFGQVAAGFGLATGIGMDAGCTADGSCRVFDGQDLRCADQRFGLKNCCDEEVPYVSMIDYVKGAYATWNLVQRAHTINVASFADSSEFGQWSDIAHSTATTIDDWVFKPVVNVVDSLKSSLPKVFDAGGGTSVPAEDVTASLSSMIGLDELKSDIARQIVDFGEAMGLDPSFLVGETGIFAEAGGQLSLNWAGNEMLSLLGEFMWWFQVLNWLYIFSRMFLMDCSDPGEVQQARTLASKRNLNLCVQVGGPGGRYCSHRFLGRSCREYTYSFCCYNSVLGRLVNEQGRAQLGRDFGSPEHPDCRGFTADEMERLDFNAMDLHEYFDTLNTAGLAPENMLSMLTASTGSKVHTGGTSTSAASGAATGESGSLASADLDTRVQAMGMNRTNTTTAVNQRTNDAYTALRSGATAPRAGGASGIDEVPPPGTGTGTPGPGTTPSPEPNPTVCGNVTPYGQPPTGWRLTFADEFSSFNSSVWNDEIWYWKDGMHNWPERNYTVEDGRLKIWPLAIGGSFRHPNDPSNYLNRTIDTDGRWYQTYGYFEIEAKLPIGKGTWPAFWLFNHMPDGRSPEIDIMEAYAGGVPPWGFVGGDGIVHPQAYAPTVWITNGNRAGWRQYDTGMDLSAGFHRYALKWEPNKQTFYFDGNEVFSLDVSMGDPMYLMLDLWYGSDSGEPNVAETPQGKNNSYEVNYVRAWQFDPTGTAPPAAGCEGGDGSSSGGTGGGSSTTAVIIDYYGDSTIRGWDPAYPDGTLVGTPAPAAMDANLPAAYVVNNYGVHGANSYELLYGLDGHPRPWVEQMQMSNATHVIINNALNDARLGRPIADYKNDLTQLVQIAKAQGKKVILETPNPSSSLPTTAQYAQAMREVAAAEGIGVIDQFQYLTSYMAANHLTIDNLMPDTVHPSQATYNLKGQYAASMFATLR